MTTDLDRAYEACRKLTALHGATYYYSTLFFPAKIRRMVFALYGFVRTADEIVDNPPPGTHPAQQLARFRQQTKDALATGTSDIPALQAFAHTAQAVEMPLEYPMVFLDAMEQDLFQTRYADFSELQGYMYGSASVVGLMMCRIMNVSQCEALQPAADLGVAMQLTNFLRDIGEDWAYRNRIYLPLDEMQKFGYSEAMLAEGIVNDAFRNLMEFQIKRAEGYFASASPGIAMLPANCRVPVRLASVLYAKILDKIRAQQHDVFRSRAHTAPLEKAVALVQVQMGRYG